MEVADTQHQRSGDLAYLVVGVAVTLRARSRC